MENEQKAQEPKDEITDDADMRGRIHSGINHTLQSNLKNFLYDTMLESLNSYMSQYIAIHLHGLTSNIFDEIEGKILESLKNFTKDLGEKIKGE